MSDFTAAGGAAFSSDRMDWETPQALFDSLDAEFHFTLDAASTDGNAMGWMPTGLARRYSATRHTDASC